MRKIIDKTGKVLICLILIFCFIFVTPKQKMQQAEAVLPAIPAVLYTILGSVVVDMAVDYGIEFVDKKAQKKWADNMVGKLWNKYGNTIKNLKPTKTNAGKWALNIGKGLAAAIVDLIGDTVEETVENSIKREDDNDDYVQGKTIKKEVSGTTDPFYNTDVHIKKMPFGTDASAQAAYAYSLKYTHLEITPKAYEQKVEIEWCISSACLSQTVGGGAYIILLPYNYSTSAVSGKGIITGYKISYVSFADAETQNLSYFYKHYDLGHKVDLFEKYKKLLSENNKTIYEFDDVIVTKGNQSTLQIPDNATIEDLDKIDSSKLPEPIRDGWSMEWDIDDSTIIEGDFTEIEDGDEFEWELIEQDIVNNSSKYEVTYNYDYEPTINNYYQVTEQEQQELDNEIQIIINNNVDVDNENGTGNGGVSKIDVEIEGFKYCVNVETKETVPCKDIEGFDGGLLAMAKNTYEFATDTVKAGVNGLKSIADTGDAISELFEKVFGWLPNEIRYLIISGFTFVTGLAIWRAFRR